MNQKVAVLVQAIRKLLWKVGRKRPDHYEKDVEYRYGKSILL